MSFPMPQKTHAWFSNNIALISASLPFLLDDYQALLIDFSTATAYDIARHG
jgi:hypothetical protein